MKTAAIILASSMVFSSLQACVTYNSGTNTYTVDSSGCVRKVQLPVRK